VAAVAKSSHTAASPATTIASQARPTMLTSFPQPRDFHSSGVIPHVLLEDSYAPITQPSILPVVPDRGCPWSAGYTQWRYELDGEFDDMMEWGP
jgi:hypothetical protein